MRKPGVKINGYALTTSQIVSLKVILSDWLEAEERTQQFVPANVAQRLTLIDAKSVLIMLLTNTPAKEQP